MIIPKELSFQAVCMMNMADGVYEQTYVNKEFGITVIKSRANLKEKHKIEIYVEKLPGKVFESFESFRNAVKELP